MGKLSSMAPKRAGGPVSTVAPALNHEGIPGAAYDEKSALYLLAVTNMVGEDTFYEKAAERDNRFSSLVRQVAAADPDWLLGLVGWLRRTANMRTAAVVAAVEAASATTGTEYPRQFIAAGLDRADEPGEALGYWLATRGRKVPTWLKRSLADAADRLYTEYSALKYDGQSQTIRFADVIEFTDPRHLPESPSRDRLWKWLLDRRHGRADDNAAGLPMVLSRSIINGADRDELIARGTAAEAFRMAGMTWESVATWLNGPWTAAAWEAVIPSMGYMALLRNLRNFDQAGVAPSVLREVADRLADPEQVAKSRQMPLRFLSAYNAVTNDRWKAPLGDALQASLANIPRVKNGEATSVLIDTSASMAAGFSKDGSLKRWDAAAMFGIAFALANGVDEVQSFSSHMKWMPVPAGSSVLNLLDRFRREFFIGHGTATAEAVRDAQGRRGNRRLLILTDEQATGYGAEGAIRSAIGDRGNAFVWNLAGYATGIAQQGDGIVTVGGLTDAGFRLIGQVEAGREGAWPWLD